MEEDDFEDMLNCPTPDCGEIKDFTIDELIGEDPMPDGSMCTPFFKNMANNIGKQCYIYIGMKADKKKLYTLEAISYDNEDYYYKLKKGDEIIYQTCCSGIEFKK